MGIMEIVLIILGVIVFVGSFLLPSGKREDADSQMSEEIIHEMVEKEVEGAKSQIGDIVDETIIYAMEKTERSMDRLTNEKMLAVNEYSDTVLEEINKNHKEVVFLYDMLNDKHENLKSTVSEAAKMAGEVKQTVKDAEILAKEVESSVTKETRSTALKDKEVVETKEENAGAREVKSSVMKIEAPMTAASEPEFTPIKAQKVELIYPVQEQEKAQSVPAVENVGEVKVVEPLRMAVKPSGQSVEEDNGNEISPAAVTAEEVEVTLDADGKRNNNDRILEMHNAGRSNMAIAKELGLGIGEVKLVIDLFEGI